MITKSDYVNFIKCPNLYYLNKFNPSIKPELTEVQLNNIQIGKDIGTMAQSYFGSDYVVIDREHLTLSETVSTTAKLIKDGHKIICEASFMYNDLYCAVDILKINDDQSVEIYEVKRKSEVTNYFISDVSFQGYVLTKLGYNVKSCNILNINSDYRYHLAFNLHDFFKVSNVEPDYISVKNNIDKINAMKSEINPIIACKECKDCPFFNHCFAHLPEGRSIFDLHNITKNHEYYNKGYHTFEDIYVLLSSKRNLGVSGERALRQIDFELHDKPTFVNKLKLRKWLDKLVKPYYFLDFEAVNDLVPIFEGEKPNFTRVMQYSIHKVDDINQVKPEHFEYLQDDGIKCNLEQVSKKLIDDLGNEGSILTYSTYEESRIESLIEYCPKYANKLKAIIKRLVDMRKPFCSATTGKKPNHDDSYVYDKNLKGGSSIKEVLPCFCPKYESKYADLPLVHKGNQIDRFYKLLNDPSNKDHEQIKDGMLKYCSLDTEAEWAILKVLFELAK